MKTTITGIEPHVGEVSLETVYGHVTTDPMIDIRVGDKVVRISLRELAAAVHGAEQATRSPAGWTLQGVSWPEVPLTPSTPWGVRQW